MFVRSMGWVVKYMSWIYSLGSFFRFGASDDRMRYSLSRRCIMNGTQATPLSVQMTSRLGKRSFSPCITQFARCTMLHKTNEIACMLMNVSSCFR